MAVAPGQLREPGDADRAVLVVVDQELEQLAALALAFEARDVRLRLLDALVGPPREEARDPRVACRARAAAARRRAPRSGASGFGPVTVSGAGAGTAPMLYTPAVIAVLYDVHGNLAALDAVLEEAHAAGAEQWILGGDYALFGAWPAETVARLRELTPAVWVRGERRPLGGRSRRGRPTTPASRERSPTAAARSATRSPTSSGRCRSRPSWRARGSCTRRRCRTCARSRPSPDPEDAELLDGTTAPAAAVRPHPRAVPPPGRARPTSSSSTPAPSACRSTATHARPTR